MAYIQTTLILTGHLKQVTGSQTQDVSLDEKSQEVRRRLSVEIDAADQNVEKPQWFCNVVFLTGWTFSVSYKQCSFVCLHKAWAKAMFTASHLYGAWVNPGSVNTGDSTHDISCTITHTLATALLCGHSHRHTWMMFLNCTRWCSAQSRRWWKTNNDKCCWCNRALLRHRPTGSSTTGLGVAFKVTWHLKNFSSHVYKLLSQPFTQGSSTQSSLLPLPFWWAPLLLCKHATSGGNHQPQPMEQS